jgi:tetratricopeptide (TPR) repeat protein
MDSERRPRTSKPAVTTLPAAVLNFSRAGLVLGQDLTDLMAIHGEQRAPAVVFYCGRILEALVASAAENFFGEATTSAAPNLNRLRELGVLAWPRDAELGALRRLGQDAVLARRQIHWADADAAVVLLQRLLTWYFVELETGPRLPTLAGESLTELVADTELLHALDLLENTANDAAGGGWQRLPLEQPGAFLRSPALAGLFLERSMAEARPDWAQISDVATLALRSFPTSVHLRQLLSDVLAARGDAAEALRVLEDLHRDYPADPDTLRRLGHLYRQSWLEVGVEESEPMLRRALQCYQEAWSRSRETDNESGVHAAVLGLHRGRAHRAESIAQTIVESYRRRWLALGSRFRFWGFDDRVALAHCALILGETEYARRRYLEAFELPAVNKRAIAAVKRQLKAMLLALDVPVSPARFLEGHAIKRRRSASAQQLELPQILNFEETQRS